MISTYFIGCFHTQYNSLHVNNLAVFTLRITNRTHAASITFNTVVPATAGPDTCFGRPLLQCTNYCICHVKEALYRILCGVNRLGDSGVNRLGDTSTFVNPVGQLLLTRRGKTRMDGVGIVSEFYIAPLPCIRWPPATRGQFRSEPEVAAHDRYYCTAKMKLYWPGHINRLKDDRWTSRVTTWRPYDKKRRQGRPAKRWRDDLDKYWSNTIWQRTAQDRVIWRRHAEAFAQPRDTTAA